MLHCTTLRARKDPQKQPGVEELIPKQRLLQMSHPILRATLRAAERRTGPLRMQLLAERSAGCNVRLMRCLPVLVHAYGKPQADNYTFVASQRHTGLQTSGNTAFVEPFLIPRSMHNIT